MTIASHDRVGSHGRLPRGWVAIVGLLLSLLAGLPSARADKRITVTGFVGRGGSRIRWYVTRHIKSKYELVRLKKFTRTARRMGISYRGRFAAPRNRTFVSATFSAAVAESHFESGGEGSTGVLIRQSVPVERLFMTYLETVQMNRKFREAEAVLLFDADSAAF